MTEFNLMNGQAIELTKDGILIKGNHIEIEGNVTIVKGTKISIVNIDNENLHVSKEGTLFFQPDKISCERLVQLEAKLSTAITEIDKLKTTITEERAWTDLKINDAVIKAKIANGK